MPRDFSEHARAGPPVRARRHGRQAAVAARRRRRGRDPAALRADRRSRRSPAWSPRAATWCARRAAQGRGPRAGGTVLEAGDTLLVHGTWKALEQPRRPATCSSSTRPTSCGARPCRSGPAPSGHGRARRHGRAAGHRCRARRRSRVCSPPARRAARRAHDRTGLPRDPWTTVMLVAGMIPLSTAMRDTGAAEKLADALVDDRRRLRPVSAADRAVPAHRGARPADQQHGDGAHRHPDRRVRGRRARRLGAPVLMSLTVAAPRRC